MYKLIGRKSLPLENVKRIAAAIDHVHLDDRTVFI